jgi:hypothetical protein
MMRIDCYGERTEGATFEKKLRREPLETKYSGKWTFQRFGEGDRVPIHKLGVDDDGVVRETWAYGAWADAETLDYIPITETMEATE